jgi:hypothetical protein
VLFPNIKKVNNNPPSKTKNKTSSQLYMYITVTYIMRNNLKK